MNSQLSQEHIFSYLSHSAQRVVRLADQVEVFEELGSTQLYLKERLKADVSITVPGTSALVLAESQLAGKGRMDREWYASAGDNILMSCSWVYAKTPKDLAGLSLALVVSLAEYLKEAYGVFVSIKWPNDLLLCSKKLAGLLVDVETGSECRIVVGLGLNVSQSLDALLIDQAWTDLTQHVVGESLDRNKIVADIYSRWLEVLMSYPSLGFESYQQRWNALSEHKGKEVRLVKADISVENEIQGVMQGVDRNGFLLICSGSEEVIVTDSSYSLRVVR